MNITLSIPPAIVQEARENADRNCTSPNRMIRDFPCEKVNEERERRRRGAEDMGDGILAVNPFKAKPKAKRR